VSAGRKPCTSVHPWHDVSCDLDTDHPSRHLWWEGNIVGENELSWSDDDIAAKNALKKD